MLFRNESQKFSVSKRCFHKFILKSFEICKPDLRMHVLSVQNRVAERAVLAIVERSDEEWEYGTSCEVLCKIQANTTMEILRWNIV